MLVTLRSRAREDEVEKVIVILASEGSVVELAQFARDPKIRPKLVVLVPYQYHPWYSEKGSFLTSLYMEIMGVVSHIYPYDRYDIDAFLSSQ
jgi:hypothetical protein